MSHENKYKEDKTVKQEKIDTAAILNQLHLRNRYIDPDCRKKIKKEWKTIKNNGKAGRSFWTGEERAQYLMEHDLGKYLYAGDKEI